MNQFPIDDSIFYWEKSINKLYTFIMLLLTHCILDYDQQGKPCWASSQHMDSYPPAMCNQYN